MPEISNLISNSIPEFNPFEGPEISEIIPTTESQLEIWLSCKLGGKDANRAFNESLSLRFEGDFDRMAFEKALNSLIVRHQSLRSAFTKDGSQMVVFKDLPLNYSFEDLSMSSLSQVQKENLIKRYAKNEVLHTFDLLYGPLFKFSLIKFSEKEHFFTLTAHHIICDGWSIGLLIQDLGKFYSSFVQNMTPVLPEADQFTSYAREQQKYITSNEYIRNENFWLDQFKNNIPVLNLPTDFPRPTPRTYKSSRIDFKLDPTLAESLKKIGIKEGCSFVNTLLAAFELFLHSITGQEDIIIGLPAAGQLVSGKYGLVGHCVNLLPIRSYPNPQLNFSEYLKVRKLAILDSYEHQKLTFSTLLKKLKTPRNASRIPLVPVVFNIDMEIENDTYFHGLKFDIFSNPREFENFELFLNLWSAKSSIQMEWSYNTQLFQKETVEKMMKDFEALLQNIVSNPLQKIENLVHLSGTGNADRQHQPSADVHSSAWYKNKFYWLRLLDGDLNIPRFPADNLVASGMAFEGQLFHRVLDREDTDALRKTMSENKGDLFTGLTAVLNILVARYTGLNDIILGGQTDTLSLGQSGQLSILPLRCRMKEGDSFNRVYAALNYFLEDASSHLEYELEDLLRELNYSEAGDGSQLFSIRSVFQHFDPVIQPGINEADISFVFKESGDDISLFIQYNSNLYNESSIQRIAGHFENILHGALMDPNMGFRDIDYLNTREKEEILKKFNHTAIGYPDKDSVVSLFEKQVLKTPENTALVFDNNAYSYARLNELSNQFANYLNAVYNLQPEDLVGIKLERSEWMIIAVLGVLKSGAAYVPVDKDYPEERISYILNDCSCKVLIDEQELNTFLGRRDTLSSNNPDRRIRPDDLAYIMYTSGSTGQPKGVMVEHRNIVRLVCSPNYIDLKGSETLLSTGAFSFDATTFEYWSMLLNGGKLVLCSQKSLLDVRLLAEEIQKHEVNVMWFTAGWLNQLIDADIAIFKGLKYLLAGGDRLSAAHINLLLQTYPSLHIINGYGPTENTTFSLTYPVNEKLQNIPVGKPIGNSTAYIFDTHMKLVPVGVEGEIYLGGAGLSRGYLNNPKLTSEKFILNPYNPFERLYRSGDIGRWLTDGNISFSGRRDQQVKIRGYRIEPGEIESAIQTYPGVEKCLVLVKEEKSREKNLVAYIASKKGVNSADLRSFLSRKIPAYMVPAHFVVMKEFPLNANGKIDRQRLPDPENASNENSRDDYQTDEEKLISEIWRDLLGIKTISRTDNFFEIGGHSLIAIQFIIRLENELNVKLPMSSLFEYPTVEKISKLISSDNKMQKWKTLIPIKPTGSKVPLYLVHGGGLGVLIFNNIVIYLDKDQPVYGLQALGIDGLDEPLETIEEMASFYISEILEQNPDGPYHIAGLSAGGLIAYDMAQQLKAMGKEVKMVGVFDFNLVDTEEAGTFSQKLMNTITNLFPIILFNIKSIFKYPDRTFKYYVMCWKLRYITMRKRLGYREEEQLDGLHMHLLNAISKSNDAIKKYKLKPYDGEIDLFISREKVYFQEDPDYMGWKPFAKKGIHVHEVNGDHDDMILQPNNKFFAEVLQRVLDKRS